MILILIFMNVSIFLFVTKSYAYSSSNSIISYFHYLVEGVGVPAAGVQDIHPKFDSRQEVWIAVDPDDSIQSFVAYII